MDDLERKAWQDLVTRAVDSHEQGQAIPVPADLLVAVEADLPQHRKDGILAGVLAGFGVGLVLALVLALAVATVPSWYLWEDNPSPPDPAPSTPTAPHPAPAIGPRPSGTRSTPRPAG